MNKRVIVAGALVATLLIGCGTIESDAGNDALKLPPCAGMENVFTSQLDTLPGTYHGTVASVLNAHMRQLASSATAPLLCTAQTFEAVLRPTPELRALARQLPEWGPSRDAALSEADMAPVLLEYLRVYECALWQRERFLRTFVINEKAATEERPGATPLRVIDRDDLTQEEARQRALITRELNVSRPTLERTLAVVGGIGRLQPLTVEIECLKRASLDLRNGLGLAAEAASCLPKILDARGTLRDLPDDE